MGARQNRWALLFALTQLVCSRPDRRSPPDPAAAPDPAIPPEAAAAPPDPAVVPAGAPPSGEMAPAGEARRTMGTRLEREAFLRPHLSALRDHFGATSQGPFDVQRVELAGGRSAVLVARSDGSDPIALAVDRDRLLWSKPRPVAGILPPVTHLALAPRPDGGVVVFGWVASLHVVAARMWADDGNPFGDFQIFAPDACDALSVAYRSGVGWIVVCTSRGGTHAQRLREDGTTAWGHEGTTLGATGASGPATIVFDSPSTALLLERVAAVGGDRLLAFRADINAQPLWSAPADLGVDIGASATADSGRVEATSVREGVVRVERPRGVAGRAGVRATEIRSGGEVRFLAP